jgi:hypothetical protein
VHNNHEVKQNLHGSGCFPDPSVQSGQKNFGAEDRQQALKRRLPHSN